MTDKARRRFGFVLTVLPYGGISIERSPADTPPTLKALQERVHGYIESVDAYLGGAAADTRAYVNEDGLFGMGAEFARGNPVGTLLTAWHEPLVGPVVIEHGYIHEGETEDVCECAACTTTLAESERDPDAFMGEVMAMLRRKAMSAYESAKGTACQPMMDPRPDTALRNACSIAYLQRIHMEAAEDSAKNMKDIDVN